MNLLSDLWKSLIEKFIIQNPAVYRWATFLLSAVAAILTFGEEFGIWSQTPLLAKIAGILSFVLAVLIQDGDAVKKIFSARK